MFFIFALILVIIQRLYELQVAKRNTRIIFEKGGIEFGENHYWVIVLLHTLFFVSMVIEATTRGIESPTYWPLLFIIFITVQMARVWIIKTMNGRWTTRILVIPGETLTTTGPFRFISHPNYIVVAIEILIFPLIFGLVYSALVFTVLNALVLLFIRIPEELRALALTKFPTDYKTNKFQ